MAVEFCALFVPLVSSNGCNALLVAGVMEGRDGSVTLLAEGFESSAAVGEVVATQGTARARLERERRNLRGRRFSHGRKQLSPRSDRVARVAPERPARRVTAV